MAIEKGGGVYTMPLGDFAPCLEDKCAMWRTGLDYSTARHIQKTPQQVDFDVDVIGYCGLAGKP